MLRAITKGGKVRENLSDWAIWSVVTEAAKEIGVERFGAHLALEQRKTPILQWEMRTVVDARDAIGKALTRNHSEHLVG